MALSSAAIIFREEASERFTEVNRFYKQSGEASKLQKNDQVFSLSQEDDIIAVLRLQKKGDDYFLRSVCVKPALRSQGLATKLLQKVLAAIAPSGCYCFVKADLNTLYQRVGFVDGDLNQANESVRQQYRRINQREAVIYKVMVHV